VPGPAGDTLVVYAEAFRRDADPDDYSLRAILAHERGHQVLARDPRLAGRAAGLPLAAEEVLASLVGARLVGPGADREALVAKATVDLLNAGVGPERAARLVGDLWGLLGELL
jgi:Zn-dependent protease with chaperone function